MIKLNTCLYLAVFSLISASSAFANCAKTVDPTKAMVFIDTNFGLTEIQSAETAACDRGETFIRFPAKTEGEDVARQQLTRLDVVKTQIENVRKQADAISCVLPSTSPDASVDASSDQGLDGDPDQTDATSADPKCTSLITSFKQLAAESDDLTTATEAFMTKVRTANGGPETLAKDTQNNFVFGMVQDGMKKLAAQGMRPTTIVISGHSSGTAFGGRFGGIRLLSLQKHILDAYANSKELLSDFRSLYLWGCNTLNPYAPEKWTSVFPTLDMIVGFQGSAPSNLNSSSWDVLDRLMHSESSLVQDAPTYTGTEDVKNAINKASSSSGTVLAVYLHDRQNDRKWFYERYRDVDGKGKPVWVVRVSDLLTAQDCAPVADQTKIDQDYVATILSGDTPISENTEGGTLRETYTRARRNDYCRAALGYPYSADQVGLLLFWHGVKRNAVRALTPQTTQLDAMLASAIADPTLPSKIEQANQTDAQNLAARRGKLEEDRKMVMGRIDLIQRRISLVTAGESLLPWNRHRKRELRRLLRRERRLKRKLKRGHTDVADALKTVQQDIAQYQEALKISSNTDKTETVEYLTDVVLSSWQIHLKRTNDQLAGVPNSSNPVDAAAFIADLRAIEAGLSPKTVSEIGPMSYADVRNRHLARAVILDRLQKAITGSPTLMNSMNQLLEKAKGWQSQFEQTAILPNGDAMDFLPWHEYIEDQPKGDQPHFAPHYTL